MRATLTSRSGRSKTPAGQTPVHRWKEPASVTLLRTSEALEHSFSDGILTIDVPDAMRTDLDDVVAVRW